MMRPNNLHEQYKTYQQNHIFWQLNRQARGTSEIKDKLLGTGILVKWFEEFSADRNQEIMLNKRQETRIQTVDREYAVPTSNITDERTENHTADSKNDRQETCQGTKN
jgi:hypothetical protein